MQDSLNILGYWWLPASEEIKLPGILTFSQEEGAILDVVGQFGIDRPEQSLLILGMDLQGHPITLSNCLLRSSNKPFGSGVGNEKYWALMIFEGAHFQAEDQIKFRQLFGCYTDLDAWVNIHGFKIERDFTGENFSSKVSYENPPNHLIEVGDNLQAGIIFTYNNSIEQNEEKITQHTYLMVENNNGDVDFEVLFEKLNIFSYLLQVATQRVPYPVSITGFSNENEQEVDGGEKYFPEIKIYYQPIEPIQQQKPLMPHEMLFTFKDLSDEQIRNWFSSFTKYETQFHLYRVLFFSNRLFLETKFLNIAQALESLHGILYGSLNLPKDEFKKRKDLVIGLVPEELKSWVENALNNANYKSFKQRIFELLQKKEYLFSTCIGDIEAFSKKVRDTRNELVHQGKHKGSFSSSKELFSATRLLSILFEIYLLEIMGFPDGMLDEIFKRHMGKYLPFGVRF